MLIIENQFITIKWNCKNKRHYEKLGYIFTKLNDPLIIKAEHLTNGSHQMLKYKCDICYSEGSREYRKLIKDEIHYCKKCSKIKREQTNLERYGVKNIFQSEDKRIKIKNTLKERYGVDSPIKNIEIKEKIKQTNLEKYGAENPFSSNICKEKIKQTNLEKYGVEHPSHSNEIKRKTKRTNLKKYGVEYALQNSEIKEKMKQTNLKRYGNENYMKTEEGKNKCKQALIEKYGENYHKIINAKAFKSLHFKNNLASKNQLKINEWVNGTLNYKVKQYCLDIVLNNNIYIEYDGSGHLLPVYLNKISKKQFNKKQLRRNKLMESLNYKLIRIINMKEINIDKEEFMILYNFCLNFLKKNDFKWIKIYYDKQIIISNIFIKTFKEVIENYE